MTPWLGCVQDASDLPLRVISAAFTLPVMPAATTDASPDADTTPEPVVLITAYGPFEGREVNGSETIARQLDQQLIHGYRVCILVMPVLWGQPARDLPPMLARLRPHLVLGLGEGGPDTVVVECIGRNRAGTQADAQHRFAPGPVLDTAGPTERTATLRYDAGWFPLSPAPVVRSTDAGDYLCNACLYTALGSTAARCGFVHVPPQGQRPDAQYAPGLVAIIRTLISHNLADHP